MAALCAFRIAQAQSPDALKKAQQSFDQAQQDYLAGKLDDSVGAPLRAAVDRVRFNIIEYCCEPRHLVKSGSIGREQCENAAKGSVDEVDRDRINRFAQGQ